MFLEPNENDLSYLPVLSDGSDLHGQVKLTSVLQVRVTESVSQSRQPVVTVDALKVKELSKHGAFE